MLTPIDRSRAHVALTRAFNIPTNPENCEDRKRAGLAAALALYGYPQLSVVFAAAEALGDAIAFEGGGSADICFTALIKATGLDTAACEVICMAVGARQRGPLYWTTSAPGDTGVQTVSITRQEVRDMLLEGVPE